MKLMEAALLLESVHNELLTRQMAIREDGEGRSVWPMWDGRANITGEAIFHVGRSGSDSTNPILWVPVHIRVDDTEAKVREKIELAVRLVNE